MIYIHKKDMFGIKDNVKMPITVKGMVLMVAGAIIIAAGLVLMMGGGSSDPAVFSEKIFDFRRLVLSPCVLIAGILLEIYAIMIKK